MLSPVRKEVIPHFFIAILWMCSTLFLCWIPKQEEFHLIAPAVIISGLSYFFLIRKSKIQYLKWVIGIAILTRLLVIPAFPSLSDDIFRFIWDGRVWHEGISAYAQLPIDLIGRSDTLTQSLFDSLNSQKYFSIYPPIAQGIFWLATLFPSDSLMTEAVILKSIHAAFDILNIFLVIAILNHLQLTSKRVLLYALNPLIIVETVANLHHEGIVISFILCCLLMLLKGRAILSGIFLSLAIATKILPLLFAPALFFYLKGKQRLQLFASCIISCLILFSPFFLQPDIIQNFSQSADLYFRKFEFNASIYYLLRWFGYQVYGFNLIHILGPVLSLMSLGFILQLSLTTNILKDEPRRLIALLIFIYLAYALFSITLHPWYIAILVALSVFTPYRMSYVWSILILFTYINYSFEPYNEIMVIVVLEYLVVASLIYYEWQKFGLTGYKKKVS